MSPQFLKDSRKLKRFPSFCKRLRLLLASGVDLYTALTYIIQDETDPYYRRQLSTFQTHIADGGALISGFQFLLPNTLPVASTTFSVPELSVFLQGLETYYSDKLKVFQTTFQQLRYPLFLMGVLVALLVFYLLVCLPYLGSLYDGIDHIPHALETLLQVRRYVMSYWIWILSVGSMLVILGGLFFGKSVENKVYSLLFPYTLSDYLWMLSLLLNQTQDLKNSLTAINVPHQSPLFNTIASFTANVMTDGNFIHHLTHQFKLPYTDIALLANGEKSGALSTVLKTVSLSLRSANLDTLKHRLALLQPLCLLLISTLIMGFFYLSFVPMLQQMQSYTAYH